MLLRFNFIFFVFFLILYIESISEILIFASLWKVAVLIILLNNCSTKAIIFNSELKIIILTFSLLVLKFFFNTNMSSSLIPDLSNSIKFAVIPIILWFTYTQYDGRKLILFELLCIFSIYLIWYNVPYLINIINPVNHKDYVELYGQESLGKFGFSGIYPNTHTSSVLMAGSSCIIIYKLFIDRGIGKFVRLIYWLTLFLGIYFLYLSYVRTGWIQLIAFLIYFSFSWLAINFRKNIYRFFGGILILGVLVNYLGTSELIVRFTENRNSFNELSFDELGSGRGIIYKTALLNWANSDFVSILLGYGEEYGKEKMYEKIGMHVFAHNGFLEMLQSNGIIGLLILLTVLIYVRAILFKKTSEFQDFSKAFFLSWLVVGLFQEFTFVYFNLMFAVSISLHLLGSKEILKYK